MWGKKGKIQGNSERGGGTKCCHEVLRTEKEGVGWEPPPGGKKGKREGRGSGPSFGGDVTGSGGRRHVV